MTAQNSTKAQIEITETIVVLLIFLILLSLGLFYYYNYYFSSLEKQSLQLSETQATTLAASITSMPEFSCSYEQNCMDLSKLFAFKSVFERNKIYYSKKLENKYISLEFIYPKPTINQECINFLPCSFFNLNYPKQIKSQFTIDSPILIYSPYTKQYNLARLKITSYT